MVNERLALLEAYLENVKLYKQHPDDVTDEMIEHLRFIREDVEARQSAALIAAPKRIGGKRKPPLFVFKD